MTEPTEPNEKGGNTSKDSEYLNRIKGATTDLEHPRHKGVKMQAHHAISAQGMALSGLAIKLKKFGYDINLTPNLVFIPYSLQGACLLGVQPHRGDHTAPLDHDDYNDDEHLPSYHEAVSLMLIEADRKIGVACLGEGVNKKAAAQRILDELSAIIVDFIQNSPEQARLTRLYKHFVPGNRTGCGGVDAVGDHRGSIACPVDRNHTGKQGKGQIKEAISYSCDGHYKLKPGN
jgi:hypothetical protein